MITLDIIRRMFSNRKNLVIRPWNVSITEYCDNVAFICWYLDSVLGISAVYETDMYSWNLYNLFHDVSRIAYQGPVASLNQSALRANDIIMLAKTPEYTKIDYDGYFMGVYWSKDKFLNFQDTLEEDSFKSYTERYKGYPWCVVYRFVTVPQNTSPVISRQKQQAHYI